MNATNLPTEAMKTITATIPAYLPGSFISLEYLRKQPPERAISSLCFFHPNTHGDAPDGWVQVGMAEITVTFDDVEKITGTQIAMLKAAKRKVQADCEVALNQIEGQIQSLLAIESK